MGKGTKNPSSGSNAWTNTIKECVAHEKRGLFRTHLWFYNSLETFAELVTVEAIWNLKLVFAYCGKKVVSEVGREGWYCFAAWVWLERELEVEEEVTGRHVAAYVVASVAYGGDVEEFGGQCTGA
ncbi:hypothetical protein HDV00_011509 [Rhizophlyctis rosea]|nr:hypothetical protein HDV00_011509 [Rhizophlyctis rosea]